MNKTANRTVYWQYLLLSWGCGFLSEQQSGIWDRTNLTAVRRWGGLLLRGAVIAGAVLLLWRPCLPFATAFALAALLQKPYRYLLARLPGGGGGRRSKACRGIAAVICVLGCAVCGGGLLWLMGALLWEEVCRCFVWLGDNASEVVGMIGRLTDAVTALLSALPFGGAYGNALGGAVTEAVDSLLPDMIGSLLAGVSAKLSSVLTSAVAALPGILLFFAVFLLSAIYMIQDYDALAAALTSHLPAGVCRTWERIRRGFGCGVRGMLLAYAKLSGVTFVLLLAGLLLLGVRGAFMLAVLGVMIDILPVFGVGTLLLPWALLSFFGGEAGRGIGLLLLYLLIAAMRQILEPRLIGKSAGLHPLGVLAALYGGGVLFGAWGLILAPFVLTVVWRGYRMVRNGCT